MALIVPENVLRSTVSYPNETSKECIQFLNNHGLNSEASLHYYAPCFKETKHIFLRLNDHEKIVRRLFYLLQWMRYKFFVISSLFL